MTEPTPSPAEFARLIFRAPDTADADTDPDVQAFADYVRTVAPDDPHAPQLTDEDRTRILTRTLFSH